MIANGFPYISMLTVHNKKQIILEGCCFKNIFKVIATWNYVLNDL